MSHSLSSLHAFFRPRSPLLSLTAAAGCAKTAITTEVNRRASSYPTVWNTSKEIADAGLRIIAVKQQGTGPAAKKAARVDMAQQLAKAYTQNGQAFNVDSSLGGEYVGQFNTLHFAGGTTAAGVTDAGTDALHIPEGLPHPDLRLQAHDHHADGHAARQDHPRPGTMDPPMYCSEFAWHMLALSSCSEAEIKSAGPEGAACVKPVFAPMQLAGTDAQSTGLAEGPLVSILSAPAAQRADLVAQIFTPGGDGGRLSSGHRAAAEQVAPLMSALSQHDGARAQGATPDMTSGAAGQLNAGLQNVPNYSPTAFLVSAVQPEGLRKIDYVATVVFVDSDADLAKAKRLAMPSGSSIPE